jgi:hypothetical protein
MTFYETYKLSLTRLGLKEKDKAIQTVLENGINAGLKIISALMGKTKTLEFTPVKNIPYTLPNDFLKLELLTQGGTILSANDYMIKSDFMLITDPDIAGTPVSMVYTYTPAAMTLTADADNTLPVADIFHNAVVSYACYYLSLHIGRVDLADKFIAEFTMATGRGDTNAGNSQKS